MPDLVGVLHFEFRLFLCFSLCLFEHTWAFCAGQGLEFNYNFGLCPCSGINGAEIGSKASMLQLNRLKKYNWNSIKK